MDAVDIRHPAGTMTDSAGFGAGAAGDGALSGGKVGAILLHMGLSQAAIVAGRTHCRSRRDHFVIPRVSGAGARVHTGGQDTGRQRQLVGTADVASLAVRQPAWVLDFLGVVNIHAAALKTHYLIRRLTKAGSMDRMDQHLKINTAFGFTVCGWGCHQQPLCLVSVAVVVAAGTTRYVIAAIPP